MAKIKIPRRHKIKEPDRAVEFSNRVLHYVSDNIRNILLAIAFLIVIAGIVSGFWIHRSAKERKALAIYNQAHQKDDEQELMKDLQEITEKYPGVQSTRIALLELGNIHYKNGDIDKAISTYQRYLEDSPYGELTALALDSLGYCFESKGDYVRASEYFKRVLQEEGDFLKDMAYINLGRVYETAGNVTEAIRSYDEFMEKYPNSPYLPMVKEKMAQLRHETQQ